MPKAYKAQIEFSVLNTINTLHKIPHVITLVIYLEDCNYYLLLHIHIYHIYIYLLFLKTL